MKRTLATSCLIVALTSAGSLTSGMGHASAATAAPTTLTGEVLTGADTAVTNVLPNPVCGDSNDTYTYTASGTATRPYPGTFTEKGTVMTSAAGRIVTQFTARFTITAADGTIVTGTKTGPSSYATGTCFLYRDEIAQTLPATYQATVHTPTGNYQDHGASTVTLDEQPTVTTVNETFTSSQTQTILIVPTSKDQCKDGGYQNFPQFKNQGECVSYVNHNS